MIDLVALWIGRVVLFVLALIVFIIACDFFRIACRRPYYCVKHLLPWKWKDENEWVELVAYQEKENQKREALGPSRRYKHYYKFYRYKRIGIMTNTERGQWWEPKRRFFWIKKER